MQRNLLFTRDLTTPLDPPDWPQGTTLHVVNSPNDPAFAALDGLYVKNHFSAGWAAGLLKGTARAIAVTEPGDGPAIAGAWLTREPFYIAEIGRMFDPGPDGDYYFGDFVDPEHRGKGLHRRLILQRLRLSADAGRRWAMAMSRDDNAGSRKNYPATGFKVAAEFTTRRLGIFSLDQLRRLDASVPCGTLSKRGLPLPGGFRLCRGH